MVSRRSYLILPYLIWAPGLLPSHDTTFCVSQAQQQAPYGHPQQWSWGAPVQTGAWQTGSSATYTDPSGFGDPSQHGYNLPQSSGSGSLHVPGQINQGSSEPEEAVPDALAHLLSAAEQASSKRK